MIRVVIYTRDRMLAAGFSHILKDMPGLGITTVYHDLRDLLVGIRPGECEVLLLDLSTESNWSYLPEITAAAPDCRVIVWADAVNVEVAHQLRQLGVRGILRRCSPVDLTIRCFQKVAAGELWFDREVTKSLMEAKTVHLTNRERDLVMLVAQGLSNKEIAGRLGIGEGTVKVYFSKLFKKLGVQDRFELALHALRWFGKGREGTSALDEQNRWPSSVMLANTPVKSTPNA